MKPIMTAPVIQEPEDACDVPEDTVFTLDANGNPVEMEVPDDVEHHKP